MDEAFCDLDPQTGRVFCVERSAGLVHRLKQVLPDWSEAEAPQASQLERMRGLLFLWQARDKEDDSTSLRDLKPP